MHHLIETDRLWLKVLDESNADLVLEYYLLNKAFLEPWEPMRHDVFFSIDAQALSLKIDYDATLKGEMVRYWIFTKSTEELIGSIAITNIIKGIFKSCYLGYKLSEKHVRQGYMVEACQAVIDIAFNEMKLHRIEANIMPINIGSINVVDRLGFKFEGFSPDYLKINGKWEGHNRYALINNHLNE